MGCPGRPNCGGGAKVVKTNNIPKPKSTTPIKSAEILLNGVIYVPKR
jgi:hypothetical protein